MKSKSIRSPALDLDPLSTTIVQDLLDSGSEWKGVNDIIKLTLKALLDIVRVQTASIKQINNTLPTRASKNQLSTGLALKANIHDVSRTFSEVSNDLETKITLNEINELFKDYISKEQFQDALVVKGYISDPRNPGKAGTNTKVNTYDKSEQTFKQITKKLSGYVTLNQFQELLTIVQQKPNINQINQILQNKVNKQVFNTALQKLISRNEFQVSLSKKSDLTDLEYIVSTLETKVDLSTIQKLTEIIQNKTDKTDIEILFSKLEEMPQENDMKVVFESIEELKSSIEKLNIESQKRYKQEDDIPLKKIQYFDNQIGSININLHSKISHNEATTLLTNLKYEVNEEIAKMKMHIRNYLNEDQNKSIQLFSVKELLKEVSQWKKQKETMNQQLIVINNKLANQNNQLQSKRLKEFERELNQYKLKHNQFKNTMILNLEQKLSTEQLQQVLVKWIQQIHIKINDDKQDNETSLREVEEKTSAKLKDCLKQIQHFSTIALKKQISDETAFDDGLKRIRRQMDDVRKTVDKVYNETDNKLNQNEYESDLADIRKKLDGLYKQVQAKSNIKDVCMLIDSKPNIEEINKALKEIHSQLQQKVNSKELKIIVEDQATINETLCEENIIGRWIWHSGQVKTGNLIPWQNQTVNTLPNNFLWDKDQTSILTLSSGLYQITVNVFSKYKPTISLLVNGEIVRTKHSIEEKEREKENVGMKKKKIKDVGSVKIHEFYMLPTRARVSVVCSGEPGCEGFLSIKRL